MNTYQAKANPYQTVVSTNPNSDQLPETWMADLLKDTARSIPDSPERLAFLAMAELEMMRIREIRRQQRKWGVMQVSLEEFERWIAFRDAINACPLTEIVWTRDGVPVDVSRGLVAEFAEAGLSNFSFPFIAGMVEG